MYGRDGHIELGISLCGLQLVQSSQWVSVQSDKDHVWGNLRVSVAHAGVLQSWDPAGPPKQPVRRR